MIETKPGWLLYIEPPKSEKLEQPIEDALTELVERALRASKSGIPYGNRFEEGSGYRGFHQTECGKTSTNSEHQLTNGVITNSLAPFYVRWYRNSIPLGEWQKLRELADHYKTDIAMVQGYPKSLLRLHDLPNGMKVGLQGWRGQWTIQEASSTGYVNWVEVTRGNDTQKVHPKYLVIDPAVHAEWQKKLR